MARILADGPPPDKWAKFKSDGLTSDQVLSHLNDLAQQGYASAAVAVTCADGNFVFVGGYKK
jgi:hypothetical protein